MLLSHVICHVKAVFENAFAHRTRESSAVIALVSQVAAEGVGPTVGLVALRTEVVPYKKNRLLKRCCQLLFGDPIAKLECCFEKFIEKNVTVFVVRK